MSLRTKIEASQPSFINLLRSSLYFRMLNTDSVKDTELVAINPETRMRQVVTQAAIKSVLGPSTVTVRGNTITNWIEYTAFSEYRPDIPKIFFTRNGTNYLNKYVPPEFLSDVYWQIDGDAPGYVLEDRGPGELDGIPSVVRDFLTHLTNNDSESLYYMLQWLATAVTPTTRNITTLVLISPPGTGKGVFFDSVIKPLFGEHNVRLVRGEDLLGGRFNNALYDRQFVLFDESQLVKTSYINRFKLLANSDLEIEQKGKDTFVSKNWLNTMITSNNLDSIRIEPGDRRYSILQTADVTLEKMVESCHYKTVTELKRQLEDYTTVAAFYNWLRTFKVSRNMNVPFAAQKKTLEIRAAGFAEWEHALIHLLNSKKANGIRDTFLEELQDYVVTKLDAFNKVGRIKMKRFTDKTNGCFVTLFDKKSRKVFVRVENIFDLTTSEDAIDMDVTPKSTALSKLGVVR